LLPNPVGVGGYPGVMPLNFGLSGKAYDPVEVTITAEEIEQYARASGDENPRHRAGPDQVASLVFPVRPGLELLLAAAADPELGVDNPLMIVHGEQAFAYHRPIRPGDTLVLSPTLESVDDKGTGATFTSRLAATTPAGEPVVDQWAVIFVRGGGSGKERPPGSTPPPLERGAVVARFTRRVDEGMPARYAAASGDHNPIHLDPAVADAVGLPGVINHGLGTLSLVTGGLVEHLVGGDPTRVRRLRARFTDVVIPGSRLETAVWDGSQGHVFETARPDGVIVVRGSMTAGGG
jgi:acyl dehydratase